MTVNSLVDTRSNDLTDGGSRRGLILAIVLVSQLMVILDASIVNIALPEIAAALSFSPAGLSWVVNAYTLAFGGLLLLGARSGDLLGRRRVFLVGIALFSAASLAGGFAGTAGELLSARVAQGIGAALAAPSALALLMIMYPEPRERNRALGWFSAVSVGGGAVGLLAGGTLTEFGSWRWVLFVNVPSGIAVLVLAIRSLPETQRHSGRFDLGGALSATAGVSSLVFGLVRAATHGWSDIITWAGLLLGGVLLLGFVAIELRAAVPITPLRLFADRDRSVSYAVRLLMVAGMFGMFFFLSQFLQDVLHYSPLAAGVAFLPLTATLFVMSQLTARVLLNLLSARVLIVIGLALAAFGLAWAARLSATSGYGSVLGPLTCFGLGAGTSFVPLTALSLERVQPADAGAASGLVNVMQQIGGAVGLALLVTVFGRTAGNSPSAGAASLDETRMAFVLGADRVFEVAAALTATALLLVVATGRRPRSNRMSEQPVAEFADV